MEKYILELIFGLIATILGTVCAFLGKQIRSYKKLLDEKNDEHTIEIVDQELVEPVRQEISTVKLSLQEELDEIRDVLLETIHKEDDTRDTLSVSWRFRLLQICRRCIA